MKKMKGRMCSRRISRRRDSQRGIGSQAMKNELGSGALVLWGNYCCGGRESRFGSWARGLLVFVNAWWPGGGEVG